jgi:hypothetical protein
LKHCPRAMTQILSTYLVLIAVTVSSLPPNMVSLVRYHLDKKNTLNHYFGQNISFFVDKFRTASG